METGTRVVIVDDHRLFAQALASALGPDEGFRVIGIAATLAEGVEIVTTDRVDVVLLDYRLPDTSGLDGVAIIRRMAPRAAVVMVTANDDERLLLSAIEAGCAGFVTKAADLLEVRTAVRRAAAGESTISPELLARLLALLARRGSGVGADLTGREKAVLGEIVTGRSNPDIARELALSVNTVRNYVQSVLTKLDAHSKLEAAAIRRARGADRPQEPAPRLTGWVRRRRATGPSARASSPGFGRRRSSACTLRPAPRRG